MALTLKQLCSSDNFRYGLHILAGEKGLDKIVQWVHTLEDEEVGDFLHGGELIFTTGIGHRGMEEENWLLPLVKKLASNDASGIVVNLGPYIRHIEQEVIDFCNENRFPLFSMPWEVHVVDVTRNFCRQIIESDKKEDTIGNILHNLIFYPADAEKYMPTLEKNGFYPVKNCWLFGIRVLDKQGVNLQNLLFIRQLVTRKIRSLCNQVGYFMMQDVMYYILGDCDPEHIGEIQRELRRIALEQEENCEIHVAFGSRHDGIEGLSQNYRRVSLLLPVAATKDDRFIDYEELGLGKLVLAVPDVEFLRRYENQILGKLEEYDQGNGTDLLGFLRIYLECDGSVQQVADQTYLHRNTVNYQLRKIKTITGFDLSSTNERVQIMMAYHIRELVVKGRSIGEL